MKNAPADFNGLTPNLMASEQAFAAWNTAQQELLALMNRRAQAYANWPSEISKCRSPQDVLEHQAKFVQDLFADWHTSAARVLAVFSPTQSERRAN
jgi:Phasin protein